RPPLRRNTVRAPANSTSAGPGRIVRGAPVGAPDDEIACQRPGSPSRASSCCSHDEMDPTDVTTSLEEALDLLIASEPFDRLLASNARPLVARAEAGQDFVAAALARALDAPVVAVATGPHEAEALARGLGAYLGPDRVALFPAWESLPYEGISPAPEVVARRPRAAR